VKTEMLLNRVKTWQKTFTKYHMTPVRTGAMLANKAAYKLRLPQAPGGPKTLYFEATNACNLDCMICPTGLGTTGRAKARLHLDEFKQIVDQAGSSLLHVVFAGYGEPFLNPDVYDMLKYARSKKIFTEVYSNLLLLKDEGLERIVDTEMDLLVVAIDLAPEGANWRFVKGTEHDIDLCKDRLKKLGELKRRRGAKRPIVRVSFPMTKANENLEGEARKFADEVGADQFLPKSVNAAVAGNDVEAMRRQWVAEALDRYAKPQGAGGHCRWPYTGGLIYANGDFAPCCHLGRGEHVLGNVLKDGVAKVWNGEKFQGFRQALAKDADSVPHCGPCVERFGNI